ncbi:hypothetical protein [Microbacterium sp. YY-01]|uniref:hypothetical protein n=1 Tax=Microbacterium sp. YY-01 TaxID=3421634 RepID=UPI003D17EAEE
MTDRSATIASDHGTMTVTGPAMVMTVAPATATGRGTVTTARRAAIVTGHGMATRIARDTVTARSVLMVTGHGTVIGHSAMIALDITKATDRAIAMATVSAPATGTETVDHGTETTGTAAIAARAAARSVPPVTGPTEATTSARDATAANGAIIV